MAAKAVVRDVGRVLGHPYGFVDRDRQTDSVRDWHDPGQGAGSGTELKAAVPDGRRGAVDIDLAKQLEGLVRNAGKHAGGVVIAPADITTFTPLYRVEGEKAPSRNSTRMMSKLQAS